jgi:hypothetical protein
MASDFSQKNAAESLPAWLDEPTQTLVDAIVIISDQRVPSNAVPDQEG